MPTLRDLGRTTAEPYIYMALIICRRNLLPTQRENETLFNSSFLTYLSGLILAACLTVPLMAESKAPEVSLLPWQLIGVDNEFATRNGKKLDGLRTQLQQSLMSAAQPLDLWLEGRGQVLPLNLKRSLHRVMSGTSELKTTSPTYVIPILCRIGDSLVVATELIDLADNFMLSAKQQFTSKSSWEGVGPAPLALGKNWIEDLQRNLRPLESEAAAFKLDLALQRSSHDSIAGSHECLTMALAHELQKTMMVPTPINLLEGYRVRQPLLPDSQPRRSSRTVRIDWGQNPTGPKIEAQVAASESVFGSALPPRQTVSFEIKASEDRMVVPEDFMKVLTDTRAQLLSKDMPQVAKIYGAWVYLDRGRAWGLEMNDRLYFEQDGRFVKGHVVGFYGSGLNLKSPRGFSIQEGAIVFIRKGQKLVKIGDIFGFDPTAYPTPWPPVRQPSKIN